MAGTGAVDSRRRARGWLLRAWAAAVLVVLLLNVVWPQPGHDDEWPWPVGLMAFPVAAVVVLTRRPGNVIGRLMAVVGASAGAIFVLSWYAMTFPAGPMSRQLESIEAAFSVLQFGGILGLLHLFPTGRPVSALHAKVVAALRWYVLVFAAIGVVHPGTLGLTGRPNPFGIGPRWMRPLWEAGSIGLIPFVLLGLWVVLARWRRAGPVERAQLKWFYGGAVWLTLAVSLLIVPDHAGAGPLFEHVGAGVVVLAFWSLPASVVIAVTRYRLFDIDRVISRTLAYALLAGTVAAVYVTSVVGLQAVLPINGSEIAVAASTLVAAAVFGPARRRVQHGIDRRYNRERYEVALVAGAFADRVRREVDVDVIARDLCAVVHGTVEPTAVHVWRRDALRSDDPIDTVRART